MVRASRRTWQGLRPEARSSLRVLSRRHRQGRLGQGAMAPAAGKGRADRRLVRDGELPDVQAGARRRSAVFRVQEGSAARALLLFLGQGFGPDARALADVGAV